MEIYIKEIDMNDKIEGFRIMKYKNVNIYEGNWNNNIKKWKRNNKIQ